MGQTHWNHRVMRHSGNFSGEHPPVEEYEYWIHEVYYDGEKITGYTENGVAPMGSTKEELRAELTMMLAALDKEDIEYDGQSTLEAVKE